MLGAITVEVVILVEAIVDDSKCVEIIVDDSKLDDFKVVDSISLPIILEADISPSNVPFLAYMLPSRSIAKPPLIVV